MCESGACPRGRRALRIVRHTVGLITLYYGAVHASLAEMIMKKISRAVCRPAEPFYLPECQGSKYEGAVMMLST